MAQYQNVAGFRVKLPKGIRSIRPGSKWDRALAEMMGSQRNLRKTAGANCTVIFFKQKTANPLAFQRCENRSLRAHNKRQCRKKSGPNKGKFIKCPPRRRKRRR